MSIQIKNLSKQKNIIDPARHITGPVVHPQLSSQTLENAIFLQENAFCRQKLILIRFMIVHNSKMSFKHLFSQM
jgi:hypothetical protein